MKHVLTCISTPSKLFSSHLKLLKLCPGTPVDSVSVLHSVNEENIMIVTRVNKSSYNASTITNTTTSQSLKRSLYFQVALDYNPASKDLLSAHQRDLLIAQLKLLNRIFYREVRIKFGFLSLPEEGAPTGDDFWCRE